MSGYLSRMAASVIRPQPRVHPFVESRFSTTRRDEPLELVTRTETTAGTGRGAEQSPIPQAADMVHPRRPDAKSEERAAEHDVFRPLLTPRAVAQPEAGVRHRLVTREPGMAAETPAAAGAVLGTKGSPQVDVKALSYEPLLTPPVAPARTASFPPQSAPAKQEPPPTLPNVATRSAAARPAMTPNATVRRSAPVASDEIQIHIGRIEVIAVPPPAPRPVAAPPRRGPTLDEYLSDGNGRAR